jgi:hypothetical protein
MFEINGFTDSSSTDPAHRNFIYEIIDDFFIRCTFQDPARYPRILAIDDFSPLLRMARLQDLLEVGPARLLAGMLKRSGCFYTSFDQDHDPVFLLFF